MQSRVNDCAIIFIVSPILIAIAAIICGMSLGTPNWLSVKGPEFGTSKHYGLWKICSSITLCDSIPVTPLLHATRATVSSSVAMTALTLAVAIIAMIKKPIGIHQSLLLS